ncbi:MAG: alpha/beta fold hydrolase [Myxococcales bacterium]
MQRFRGLKDLIHDVIEKTTDLVQETHEAAARKPRELLANVGALEDPVRAVDAIRQVTASLVFDSIRATNRGVQRVEDLGLEAAEKLLAKLPVTTSEPAESEPAEALEAEVAVDPAFRNQVETWVSTAQSALNAVAGDFLHARKNGLAITLSLYRDLKPVPLTQQALLATYPQATSKVCLFVHGLGHLESGFQLFSQELYGNADTTYGSLLERELGFTALYLRYNTGRRVSENGRELALLLEELAANYPLPLSQLVLVGHSMGGLVVRSAAHYGAELGHAWVKQLSHVFCLGSPHQGAPLEKAGNVLTSILAAFDTAGTQVPAKVFNARSAGIKDLRFGNVVDEDWKDFDPDAFLRDQRGELALVPHVTYCAIASTVTRDPAHPVASVMGDLLVRTESAQGGGPDVARRVAFQDSRILSGLNHIALLNHPAVYAEIKRCLTSTAPQGSAATRPDEAQPDDA